MMNVMLSNTGTGKVNNKGGGMKKDMAGDCTVVLGNQGTSVWLLPDKRGVAGDGVGKQVEAKTKTILNALLGKSSFIL